jgi:transposase-like protein
MRRYGRVTVYTDGAGWCVDACRWAGVEHVVYDRPLRNLVERTNQYLKDRTEPFDGLYPTRRHRHPFERVLSWLSGFKFLHKYVLANTGLERAPVEWSPPPWMEESEFGRVLGWIVSLG